MRRVVGQRRLHSIHPPQIGVASVMQIITHGRMLLGYLYIILAASLWGTSAVVAKKLFSAGQADALLISQSRATFAWLIIATALVIIRPRLLVVRPADLWRFLILGVVGVCGGNYFLYYAIGGMDTAVADLIQFTAPAMVVLWMWQRGHESLDRAKLIALILSLAGCGLALGAFGKSWQAPSLFAASAFASALCYAFLLIWGKKISARYETFTYLHYALLGAALFWAVVVPPEKFLSVLTDTRRLVTMAGFGLLSVAAPYMFFFMGLKRLPASRAGIASTFEPVFITLAAAVFLGEHLQPLQLAGVGLVVAAIVILEIRRSARSPRPALRSNYEL